ncbi:MAG: chorismate mutase [Amycolatopsis sp.]|uniref:chorismate mutase n=1 Tax=Amycolatopsis sp. TaxID=37632 RepID=UPI0026136374|nr:chorismate mutase [Amycolatopsis sp.]MCU1683502.1 chorismate mutase [Amycolatopsis sp.]
MNAQTDQTANEDAADSADSASHVVDLPAPTAEEIGELRKEIDFLDAEILRLVKRRVEVSKTIGVARMAAGGTRIVYNREMDVLARYRELGPEGRRLAMALLDLGRGRLGR